AAVTDTVTKNTDVPSGVSGASTSDPVNTGDETAVEHEIIGGTLTDTYAYEITDGSGGSVTGSGTIGADPHGVTNVDVSGLDDGTLTVSVIVTDTLGNPAAAVTDTVTKDTAGPPPVTGFTSRWITTNGGVSGPNQVR